MLNTPPLKVHVKLLPPVTASPTVVAYWLKLVKALLLSKFSSKRKKNVAIGLLLVLEGVRL